MPEDLAANVAGSPEGKGAGTGAAPKRDLRLPPEIPGLSGPPKARSISSRPRQISGAAGEMRPLASVVTASECSGATQPRWTLSGPPTSARRWGAASGKDSARCAALPGSTCDAGPAAPPFLGHSRSPVMLDTWGWACWATSSRASIPGCGRNSTRIGDKLHRRAGSYRSTRAGGLVETESGFESVSPWSCVLSKCPSLSAVCLSVCLWPLLEATEKEKYQTRSRTTTGQDCQQVNCVEPSKPEGFGTEHPGG